MLVDFFKKIRFWLTADRIGPDIPINHWMLHFNGTMKRLGIKKFKYFHPTASFRAGAYAVCCSKISIGAHVTIRPGTMLFADPREGGAGIHIEEHALIGSGVHMYVNNHRFSDTTRVIAEQGWEPSKPIILKKGCWIGANAILLPGVTIGQNSVVGAGSIVTKDVPDFCVAVGAPAKIIKRLSSASSDSTMQFVIPEAVTI
ncbi:acyltransferase [Legionella hackeliae]|uniref:Maltose O-acetyltransferase n=1 Tax=Legionella hackeliae TaxID=449 RepID=A0A0A8UTZ2_LEGHA|nr:acyltransferase [Legionella hackeliae]KTD08801.1 chloramphenicol acetyltransferase [Legionella hackeliae]CEK10229.1 Maltose O-acetyltransferase [Legionella hackeliae]STX46958.1 chloramphenicol acetyltransferase [Legionella hackeliae]